MNCPVCGGKCKRLQRTVHADHIKRDRWCAECGHAYTTIEVDADYFEKYKEMIVRQVLDIVEGVECRN